MPVYEELVRRIGQVEAARRMGVSYEALNAKRLSTKRFILESTYRSALGVLYLARQRGEDNFDRNAAKAKHLDRVANGRIGGIKVQQQARNAKQYDWQLEQGIDGSHCQSRWHDDAIRNGWPLADFECEHDRLPGDATPSCGCWPREV